MSNYLKLIIGLVLIGIFVVFSGCVSENKQVDDAKEAVVLCQVLCKDALSKGTDLSRGPCLSDNNEKWNVSDWVCDVAHMPRQQVDNLKENQCKDYYEGRAHHFVEVNENCEVIRVI